MTLTCWQCAGLQFIGYINCSRSFTFVVVSALTQLHFIEPETVGNDNNGRILVLYLY